MQVSARTSLEQAICAWREALGGSRVMVETGRYNADTSSFAGEIPVALRPVNTEQVQDAVRIAQRFGIAIYPLSTGHNWGYGTSVPVRSPGAIVDLSAMNKILEFDEELGVVTMEPGVTQGQLSEYLAARGLPFMVPVTGAGPSCSVVANALERGFGVTPMTDHFGAVMSLKAVLPSGELYESYMRTFPQTGGAQGYRWGTGPYLDGLFSQSNLGIVVDASVALQRTSERCGALLFVLDSSEQLEGAARQIRELLRAAGANIGGINLMSRARVECMLGGARNISGSAATVPPGAWFGFGSVYGSRELYGPTCALVKRMLRGRVRGIHVYTATDVKRLRWLSAVAKAAGWSGLTGMVERLAAAVQVVAGVPSTFALPLAYAKSGRARDAADLDPARDGCGLFWYSPIVPMRTGVVKQYVEFAERICGKHGIVAAITLTSLSPRCFASTIPLLFERGNAGAEDAARLCFEELYDAGTRLGFVPYRMGAQFMPMLASSEVASAIKAALDPSGVLAPGRYQL